MSIMFENSCQTIVNDGVGEFGVINILCSFTWFWILKLEKVTATNTPRTHLNKLLVFHDHELQLRESEPFSKHKTSTKFRNLLFHETHSGHCFSVVSPSPSSHKTKPVVCLLDPSPLHHPFYSPNRVPIVRASDCPWLCCLLDFRIAANTCFITKRTSPWWFCKLRVVSKAQTDKELYVGLMRVVKLFVTARTHQAYL